MESTQGRHFNIVQWNRNSDHKFHHVRFPWHILGTDKLHVYTLYETIDLNSLNSHLRQYT